MTGQWREVVDRAGRCTREHTETATLPATAMHALCGPCHDSTARKQAAHHAEALRGRAEDSSLF